MAYQKNIPQPTDVESDSQNDMLNNFQTLNTAWEINHVAFDAVNQGKHKFILFPNQDATVPIDPVTGASEVVLYSKTSTLTAATELFYRPVTSGTVVPISARLAATPGWAYLPSGVLLKWGASTANGAGTITLPAAGTIPVFTTVFSVQLTVVDAAGADADEAIRLVSFIAASFDVWASPRSTTGAKAVNFEYLVIGV